MSVQSIGDGIPFVWAHGLMSSIQTENELDWFGWKDIGGVCRLIRYDARCHGHSQMSPLSADLTWRALGADMLAVADAADAHDFIAGGMSMGCATAIHAAIQAPDRIKGLMLAMPPMVWETRAAQRALYQRIAGHGRSPGDRALDRLMGRDMARTLPQWLVDAAPGQSEGLSIGVNALAPGTVPALYKAASESDLPPRGAFGALAHIPTLILGWSGDPLHPVSSAQELHRVLPASELHIADSYAAFQTFPAKIRAFIERVAQA
ncbi:alpha/beta fold hydrolase [Massilia cavernae]|uniref:Alpha/beta hydrolase n=1 Tax=Massilia cavernae TaxID=2320864 RepID=A0A418XH64_9BURK|nr:alpha/beta hydrolase [Massilia cavernae]RJG11808.1 alpha/beta hydrolase [Massilia cavernae]